jgi:hypothetical protein
MSTTQELVERLRMGTANSRHPMCLDMQEAAARLDELERENARMREALKEARSTIASVMIAAALAGSGEP